jgi:hypothetical protein
MEATLWFSALFFLLAEWYLDIQKRVMLVILKERGIQPVVKCKIIEYIEKVTEEEWK